MYCDEENIVYSRGGGVLHQGQGIISPELLEGKLAPKVIYLVFSLEKELLTCSEMAP